MGSHRAFIILSCDSSVNVWAGYIRLLYIY